MTIWFSSDQHFNHKNILKYTSRPYDSIEAMNADLVARWNRVVKETDTIYHLGDFAFAKRDDGLDALFAKLQGIKHLIKGNHDDKFTFQLPWRSQEHYAEIKIDGVHVVLFHYAIVKWDRYNYGAIHLHGHHHGTLAAMPNRIDVGIDAWGMNPVSWDQLKAPISDEPSQHHSIE